jgi:hypothetical protein
MKTEKVPLGRWGSCSELCSVDFDIAKDPSITQNLSIDGFHLSPRISGAAHSASIHTNLVSQPPLHARVRRGLDFVAQKGLRVQ